jgi:hypothetical protein
MPLDPQQIAELYKEPKYKEILATAGKDNARQSYHAKLSTSEKDAGPYAPLFIEKVREILQNEPKTEVFKKLLNYPLLTSKVISAASDEWNKVFYAENRTIEIELTDDSLQDDLESYLDSIGFNRLIEQSIFTKAKQAVNTIALIDLPNFVQEGQFPAPFVSLIDAGTCHDIGVNANGQITHLLYTIGKKGTDSYQLVVLDEGHYRLFSILRDDTLSLLIEAPHPLGYCPACFIWHDVVEPTQPIRRFNGVLESVEDLDKLLIAETFAQHADLYSAFPILWQYVSAGCEYVDRDGNPCVEGYITYEQDGQRLQHACPACSKQELIGPGTIKDVPQPITSDQPQIGQPAGFINAERTLLDYNTEKVKRLTDRIYRDLTGFTQSDGDMKGAKQFNEDQVAAQNESRQAVLQYWAENLQVTHQFLLDTIGRLRFGDAYVGSTVNYGDEFLLVDAQTATRWYQEAKEAGLPMYLLTQKRRQIEQLYARISPSQKERMSLLRQLEPFPDLTWMEVPPGLAKTLKMNFAAYIDRFERENGPLVRFGADLRPDARIERITNQLYQYVRQDESVLWQSGQEQEVPDSRSPVQSAQQERQPVRTGAPVNAQEGRRP